MIMYPYDQSAVLLVIYYQSLSPVYYLCIAITLMLTIKERLFYWNVFMNGLKHTASSIRYSTVEHIISRSREMLDCFDNDIDLGNKCILIWNILRN